MNILRTTFIYTRIRKVVKHPVVVMAMCLLLAGRAHAGLLGADINADPNLMEGDYIGGAYSLFTFPLYNQPGVNASAYWNDMVEQYDSAKLDFVAIWLKGDKQPAGMPASFQGLVAAINNRGVAGNLKVMPFDDNPASWTAQWNLDHGNGYGYAVPFDISNTNNWVYVWDNNLKVFFQNVPDANRLKINGRPVYSIWSLAPAFVSNANGNASKLLTYIRQQCQATFGFNPYIEVPEEWIQNDPSSNDPNIIDAVRPWFVPVQGAGTYGSWNTYTWNGVTLGCAVPGYGDSAAPPATWIDPNHGVTLATGLQHTVNASSMTFVEGFDDYWEATTCWRAANLDSSGNVETYTQMAYQDYPNQRINILREYGNNPFPTDLKEEAEGCDTFGGGVGGGYSANYYRNGNISIYPCTDTYGGYSVGNIQNGQWLQWSNVPLQGSFHISVRVATANTSGALHFVIDGTSYPSVTLPNTGGLSTWQSVDAGGYTMPANSYHTVTLTFDSGGYNVNFWQLSTNAVVVVTNPPATPTGLAATPGDAQVDLSWASSAGATGYNLKRSNSSGGTYTTIAPGLSGLAYTDTSVANGNTYYYEVSATNNYGESANSSPVSVTPSLTASLVTWFHADAITGVGNGAGLATWTDSSGNGYNATQTTSGQQPTYVTGAMNGLPVVRFNSANSTYLSFNRPVQDDFTIIIVYQSSQTSQGVGTAFFQGAGLVNGDQPGVADDFGTQVNADGQITVGTGNPDTSISSGSGFNDGKPHVVTFERTESTGALALFVDGTQAATGTGGTESLTAPPTLDLGAVPSGGGLLTGDIAEVKIYDTPLVTADRQAQESSLGTKYNIAGLSSGPLPASKLTIRQQPSTIATAGQAFAQQPVIVVQDSNGNTVSNYSGTVTASETSGGTLNGTAGNSATASVVSGVATFSGLFVTNAANGVTLAFSAASLPSTNSTAINVSAGAASRLVIRQEPSATATAGQVFAQQPMVAVQDASGNTVTTYSTAVTASETAGGTINGTAGNSVSASVVSGVATFSGLYVTNAANGVTLTFASGSLPSTNSSGINISAQSSGGGQVTQLIWTTQPGNAVSGQNFGTQPVLKTADSTGTPSTTGLPASLWVAVSLTAGNGPLTGTTMFNMGTGGSNGVANFSNLQIGAAGTGDQLIASLCPAPGAVIWLDANNAGSITTNSSGVVSNWTNLGTRGAALGVPTSVNGNTWTGPSWVANSMNGKPVIRFSSASTTQNPPGNVLTNSWLGLDTGTDIHFFTVMRQAANPISNWPGLIGFGNSGAAAGKSNSSLGEDSGDSVGGFRIFRNDANNSPAFTSPGQFTTNNFANGIGAAFNENALGAWYNERPANNAAFINAFYFQGSVNGGADYWLDQNGNTWTNFQTSTASYGNFNITDFGIGAQLGINTGSPLDGPDWPLSVDIAEVLVYTNTLSVADRLAVQAYLQGKWLGAPLYASATSTAFNVSGTGGTPPVISATVVPPNLVLSWPTNNNSAYQLQFSPSLLPGSWSGAGENVGVTNGEYQAAVPITSAAGFYRLMQ